MCRNAQILFDPLFALLSFLSIISIISMRFCYFSMSANDSQLPLLVSPSFTTTTQLLTTLLFSNLNFTSIVSVLILEFLCCLHSRETITLAYFLLFRLWAVIVYVHSFVCISSYLSYSMFYH